MSILDIIQNDKHLEVVATIDDDRLVVKVPIDCLESHPTFQALRDTDPKDDDFKVIVQSLKDRGMFYLPLVYADVEVEGLSLFIVDGHQRIRAAKKAGQTHVIVCIVVRWNSVDEAFRDGASAQFARFAVGENDVFSIAATGKLTTGEIVTLTGFSESKVRRIVDIADQPKLSKIVKAKLVGTTLMHKLLKQCGSNPTKIEALTNLLVTKAKHAVSESKKWTNRISSDRTKKWDKAAKEKADAKYYFKDEDWDAWLFAIGDEHNDSQLEEDDEGNVKLKLDSSDSTKKFAIRLGDPDEWDKLFALYNMEGKKHDEVDLTSLGDFVKQLPLFCDRIEAVYKRRCSEIAKQEALADHPTPTSNTIVMDDEPPADPVVQNTDEMEIE